MEPPAPPAKAAKKQRAADPDIDDEDEPVIDNAWRCVPKDVLRLWMGCKVVPEFVRTGLVAKDLSKEWYEVVVAARREELAAAKEVAEKGTTTKLDELTSRVGHPVIGFTGTTCPTCGMAQIWCVSGVTCSNEHGFAEPNIPAPKPQKSPPPGKKSPDVEVLRLAKTLRNVIEHLKGCGYQTADEMFEACESVRDKVPVLQKIADLQLRLPRALEVLKAEAETRANASLQ